MNSVTTLPIPESKETSHFTHAVNSTKQGVGRIETFQNRLLINNIGCNFEFFDAQLSKDRTSHFDLSRSCVFAQTAFPGEDLGSLLDLDAHVFIEVPGYPYYFVSNHFGTMRAFHKESVGTSSTEIEPDFELQWFGDTERLVILQDWLLTTSPRGHETSDPARPGLFASDRLSPLIEKAAADKVSNPSGRKRHQIPHHNYLADWGFITGLAVDRTNNRAAIIADRRLALLDVLASKSGSGPPSFSAPLWEFELPFSGMWSRFNAAGTRLYIAGSAVQLADDNFDDWDTVNGGGLVCVDCRSGKTLFATDFSQSIAWGYGSVPLVLHSDEQSIFGLDRRGGLIQFDCGDGTAKQLYEPTPGIDTSLGLAHAAQLSEAIVAGFNRGGYKILLYPVETSSKKTG